MNRTLIAAIVIIIAACVGLYFWAESEKARFDASLPQPPAKQVIDDSAGGHWHGDEWHAEPHPAPAVVEPPVDAAPAVLRLPPLEEVHDELRAILAVPLPPNADELDREWRAHIAEGLEAYENAHTLSEAERRQAFIDRLERTLAFNKRFSKRARARRAAIQQEAAARRARKRMLNKNTVIGAFLLLALIGCALRQRSRERREQQREEESQ